MVSLNPPTEGRSAIKMIGNFKTFQKIPINFIKKLDELGFEIFATKGTAEFIAKQGIKSKILRKVQEGSIAGETTSTEAIMKGDIDLVVNTPHGGGTRTDGFEIRSAATKKSVPHMQ